MLVYVIEDDPIKGGKIRQFLQDIYSTYNTVILRSFQSGLKAIEGTNPDLLILDMTLPTFDRSPGKREGRLRPLGGYDLVRKVKLRSISLKFIIVSQLEYFGEGSDKTTFDQVTEDCRLEFPEMFVGSVYFSQTSLVWQRSLAEYIDSIKLADIHND